MSDDIFLTTEANVPRVRRADASQYGAIPRGMREAFERAALAAEPVGMTEAELLAEPTELPEGYTAISPRQRTVHRTTELLAVLGIPFFAWLVFNKKLPGWARLLAAVYGIGTVVVDAGLLATWTANDEGRKGPWSGWRR